MLALGIILTICGLIVFLWVGNSVNKSIFERPMIFNRPKAVMFFHTLWVLLLLGGLYSFWHVNPTIVFVLVGIFVFFVVLGYIRGSEKAKAKRIFKIYKQLKLFRPKSTEEEIFRETAVTYYKQLGWNEAKISTTLDYVLKTNSELEKDVKSLVSSILVFADIDGYHSKNAMERMFERPAMIDSAYESVIGNESEKPTERPELSKFALEWIQSAGLNPDEMSNEQLQVFAEMDDHSKSSFIVKGFYGVATVFLFLAIFALFTFDLWEIAIYLFISFVLWFIGNKIQMRRISKKFYEASILKYSEEQAQNN